MRGPASENNRIAHLDALPDSSLASVVHRAAQSATRRRLRDDAKSSVSPPVLTVLGK